MWLLCSEAFWFCLCGGWALQQGWVLVSHIYATSPRWARSSRAERGSRGSTELVPPSLAMPGFLLLVPRLIVHEQQSRTHGQLRSLMCVGWGHSVGRGPT